MYLDNVQPSGKMMKIKMFSKIGEFQDVSGDLKHMGGATGGLKHGDELVFNCLKEWKIKHS